MKDQGVINQFNQSYHLDYDGSFIVPLAPMSNHFVNEGPKPYEDSDTKANP